MHCPLWPGDVADHRLSRGRRGTGVCVPPGVLPAGRVGEEHRTWQLSKVHQTHQRTHSVSSVHTFAAVHIKALLENAVPQTFSTFISSISAYVHSTNSIMAQTHLSVYLMQTNCPCAALHCSGKNLNLVSGHKCSHVPCRGVGGLLATMTWRALPEGAQAPGRLKVKR